MLANYELMDQAPTLPHADIVTFVRDRKLHGRGIGWIDAHLLASALQCEFIYSHAPPFAAVHHVELAEHLAHVEAEALGFADTDPKMLIPVGKKLLKLSVRLKSNGPAA